jgi:hypothetical protein
VTGGGGEDELLSKEGDEESKSAGEKEKGERRRMHLLDNLDKRGVVLVNQASNGDTDLLRERESRLNFYLADLFGLFSQGGKGQPGEERRKAEESDERDRRVCRHHCRRKGPLLPVASCRVATSSSGRSTVSVPFVSLSSFTEEGKRSAPPGGGKDGPGRP